MAEMMDDIAHLSQEIGPRPAGTEEEQQAALYIADELQKSAGFSTVVEDVSCASNGNSVRFICFIIAFVCTLLAIIFPVLSIPCFIIGLLVAALFVCEALGRPILSRFLRNGVSQNVVAKYNPTSITSANKRRKIILVTHYDSARVRGEYQGIFGRYLPIIRTVEAVSLLVAPIVLLIKMLFFASEAGGFAIVLTVLQVLCLIVMALPIACVIKTRFSPYNEAANNDAAGVAVLLDVARTVGNGLVSAEEMEDRAREAGVEIHGEEAAYEAEVVPDGVEVTYQAKVRPREAQMSPEESLAAAKAAIAALTGKPVADKVPLSDISSRLVHHGEFFDTEEDVAAAAPHFEVEEEGEARLYTPSRQDDAPADRVEPAAVAASETVAVEAEAAASPAESFVRESVEALQPGSTGMDSSYQKQVPSWAKAAQEKAHANKPDLAKASGVSRSRFADAPAAHMADAMRRGDAPAGVSAGRAAETAQGTEEDVVRETPQEPESELSKRLAALRSEIESAADAAAPSLKVEPVAEERVVEAQAAAASVTPVAQPAAAKATIADEPVLIEDVEPQRQTTAHLIEQEEARANVRARGARRSVSQKGNIGGFLGRAAGMVNSVSSKVANFKESHGRGHEADEDAFDEFEDDVVLVEETFGEVEGRTVSMPSIDVMQLDEEQTDQVLEVEDDIIDEEVYEEQPIEVEGAFEEVPVAAGSQFVEIEQPEVEPVSPIMGMEEMTSALPEIQQETVTTEDEDQPDRHVIVLPDVIAPVANNMEGAKQRAPMAVDADKTQPQAPSLLSNMLPQIGPDGIPVREHVPVTESRTFVKPLGGLDLPDFSTNDFERVSIDPIPPITAQPTGELTVAMGSAGNTGSFSTVSAELAEESVDETDFVADADDSVFDEGFTQSGAFAGPDYVEMPQSRVGRLFGRFGKKKKKQEEQSIREWVDVDSSYEAREVGRQRGSWESFREEDETDIFEMDFEAEDDGRDWNGGAFSLQSLRNRVSGAPHDAKVEEFEEFAEVSADQDRGSVTRSVPKDVKITEEINNELRLLRDFRHPDIDTEVWFVALGAEEAMNSGMHAFIDEHRDELKGAIIVNLEGLGAGQFSFIDEEGEYRPTKVSSRMKRLLRQASERSRVPFETSKLLSRNTAAHVAAQKGFQALTLAGMDDNQTAYYASLSDTVDNVEPATLEQNSRFVLELLKSV